MIRLSSVGYATLSVIPSMKGFGSKLSAGIDPHMSAAGTAGGKKFGGGMMSGAKKFVGPIAALFAAKVGVDYFKGAIAGASDLSESASKVGIVFGKQSAQIMAASKTSAKAMGLSQNAYLAATGGLGNLLVSLKIAPKAAAGMSQQMVKLAGDLASFNNVAPEEALAALQSGLTGETEPLKRFGVNMNDATLKAQALKMGLIKTTKEALSPQTKALAAQALIMDQTGTAQGDFARTSGGLANQQRILAARTEEFKTKLGGFLLPVVTKFVTFLNNGMGPSLSKVTAFFTPLIEAVKVFFSFLNGNDTGVDGPFREMAVAGVVVRDVLKSVIDHARIFFTFLTGNAAGVGAGKFTEIATAGTAMRGVLGQVVEFVQTQVVPAFQAIAGFVTGQLIPAVTRLYAMVLPALLGLFKSVTKTMQDHKGVIDFVKTAFGILGDLVVNILLPALGNIAKLVLTVLGPVFRGLVVVIEKVVIPGIKLLVSAVLGIIGAILSGAAKAFGWIPGIGPKLQAASREFNAFRDRTNAALSGIKDRNITVTASIRASQDARLPEFANGTNFAPGGAALVGERGPEIVNLPRGSKVTPNHALAGMGGTPRMHPDDVAGIGRAVTEGMKNAASSTQHDSRNRPSW